MADGLRQLGESEYPALLREIPEPPERLWAHGSFPPEGYRLLTVIGSRALTAYGRKACETLIRGLSGYPVSIVSGLSLGTEACAHRAALAAGLHTIAVAASGLNDDVLYPRSNRGLAKDILASGGLLLSEEESDHEPALGDFAKRNRIMVGLSHAVLIIEAEERSGTLIAARLTHEYNRDLLCIPHRMNDPHAFGANLFLRLGATLIAELSHLLEALHLPKRKKNEPLAGLGEDERAVYDLLETPLPRRELISLSPLHESATLAALVTLELKGYAKEELGLWQRI